jgi:hypothetical protein
MKLEKRKEQVYIQTFMGSSTTDTIGLYRAYVEVS